MWNVTYYEGHDPSLEYTFEHPTTDTNSKYIPLSISSLQLLNPNIKVGHWTSKGISTVDDIKTGPSLKTFRAAQIEHGLELKDHYAHIQVSHLLLSIPNPCVTLPWRSFLYLTNPNNFFNQNSIFSKTPSMKTWEIDLMSSFTSEQWQTALTSTYTATKSINLWELT